MMFSITQQPALKDQTPYLFLAGDFELHFTQASEQDERAEEYATDAGTGQQPERRLRALVVDDTEDIALFFAFLLERAGYQVETAYSGPSALERARRERFSLVVSDIGMPQMDGYELARRLRQLPGYESVPLIAVTGYAQFYERERAISAGFNAHLKKPVDADVLLRAINDLDES